MALQSFDVYLEQHGSQKKTYSERKETKIIEK